MSAYLARVFVTLKPAVNDPQGLTIRGGLHSLGFAEVGSVRAGKYLEIHLEAANADDATARITEMCRKLFANPVIEDFRYEVAEAAAPPAPPPAPVHQIPLARLLIGAALVVGGVLWLLAALDVFEISPSVVLSAILIAVGLALIAGSRTGRHSGLVVLGVVLTIVLALGSSLDISLAGGIGDKSFHPSSLDQLEREYRLGVGQLTLDFSNLTAPPGSYTIKARVGIGQIVVTAPPGTTQIVARARVGDVEVSGRHDSGFDALASVGLGSRRVSCGVQACFELDLSVGVGQVTVNG